MSAAAIPRPPGDIDSELWQCHVEVQWPEGGGTCVRLAVSDSMLFSTTSIMGGSWVGSSAHWWHSRVAAPGKRIEEPQAPCLAPLQTLQSHHVAAASTLVADGANHRCIYAAYAIHHSALMCQLSDRGACNTVLTHANECVWPVWAIVCQ